MREKLRQIVAMGGGGFSMEPRNLRMDGYVLSLSRERRPRVCFLGTAGGDSRDYIRRFYLGMEKHRCAASDLPLFRRDGREPGKILLEQDVIYVGGGNTANMLAIWRLHGVDRVLREAWRRGIVLCGVSAGMLCWFEGSVTDSFGPLRALKDGLGLLPGSACAHYNAARQRPTFQRLVRTKILPDGVAADDGAAIHFVGRKIFKCVSSRPAAKTCAVKLRGGVVEETVMETEYLDV